jgi:hypothetical protein
MRKLHKFLIVVGLIVLAFYLLSLRSLPKHIIYGVSFSKFHSDELGLDWKKTYLALLDDLKVRNFRFTAHWPLTELKDGKYNFSELDFQMQEAQKSGASVILAVGRRLPGWPECHEPDWAKDLPLETKQQKLIDYITTVVNRYKSYKNIKYWQVENEPYLAFFSRSLCGPVDEEFFKKEIALVHQLDPAHPVLITDSGEFGTWYKAYQHGDIFGASMYLYVWWTTGPLRYPITPAFFRIKENLIDIFFGKKPSIIIELSGEPWLRMPIVGTSNEILLSRMGIDKFNEMIDFASKTSFDSQYLWGAEWWYWMKTKQNHPEFWNRAKELFSK